MSNVYFAASIRGGREQRQLYHDIISCLKLKFNVLTEHIADENLEKYEHEKNDEAIYKHDINLIFNCDLLIAECSTPSLGVGYEIAFAEKLNKPIIVFYNNECNLSAMIKGNNNVKIYQYNNFDDICKYIININL